MSSVIHIGTLIFEGVFGLFAAYASYSLFSLDTTSASEIAQGDEYAAMVLAAGGNSGRDWRDRPLRGLPQSQLVAGLAAVWMICYFVVATGLHVAKHSLNDIAPAIVFLVLAVGLTALLWGDLTPVLHAL